MNAAPLAVQIFGLAALSNVFMTFTRLSMRQSVKLRDLWAARCPVGAVHFTCSS
jgi:uncharacterized protein (DUF486 family)